MESVFEKTSLQIIVETSEGAWPECDGWVVGGNSFFWLSKRVFDIVMAVLALPVIAFLSIVLLVLNPWCNPGPLFFRQGRMGRGGKAFTALKFRSMLCVEQIERGAHDPLETWRITPLGVWLRQRRLDEFPQFINVFFGEMSVIGPRPDYIDHARVFARTVPGYSERYLIRPGISGYAQVRLGYAEGTDMTTRKTQLDHVYIRNASWRVDAHVLLRTLFVMQTGFGAR